MGLVLDQKKSYIEVIITKIVEENTNVRLVYGYNEKADSALIIRVINRQKMFANIIRRGELGFAESYMDGDWETDDLKLVLKELTKNRLAINEALKKYFAGLILSSVKNNITAWFNRGTLKNSRKNIPHHYDAGNDLYLKMLDKNMQYTCAYFHKENMTLDDAQYAKMELVAKKLDLKPGMTVLDIGCGFGSMAYHLAKNYNVKVTGVTLSNEQKKLADQKFSHPNATIKYMDYREINNMKFDRVYSIGMFEHVGKKCYAEYFDKCYELLNDNGIMLLHTIGDNERHAKTNPFIQKYIFPGGYLPHLSDLTGAFLDGRWHLEDWHNFGLSYAKTLDSWYNNIGDWSNLTDFSDSFRRMWAYYLLGCAAFFELRIIGLWQIIYTKLPSNRPDDCHHIRM